MDRIEAEAAARTAVLNNLTKDVKNIVRELHSLREEFRHDIDVELVTTLAKTVQENKNRIWLILSLVAVNTFVATGAMAVSILTLVNM